MSNLVKARQCANCNKIYDSKRDIKPMFKCGKCLLQYYCDKECQQNHWNAHKLVCVSLRAIAPDYNISNQNHPINQKIQTVINFIKSNVESRISLYKRTDQQGVLIICLAVEKLDEYLDIIKNQRFPITEFIKNPSGVPNKITEPIRLPMDAPRDQTIHNKELFEINLFNAMEKSNKDGYLLEDLIKVYVQITFKGIAYSWLLLLVPNYILIGFNGPNGPMRKIRMDELSILYDSMFN